MGYSLGDSLIQPMVITAILLVQPKGYLEPCNYLGSQSPAEPIKWIWIGWPGSTLGNWQKGRPTHLMAMTELLHIQFQRKFLITYSDFWLVNILLQLFDIWSQKRNEKEKNIFLLIKNKKNVKKVYVNIKHSVHWGISPPPKIPTPLFLAKPS